MDFRESETYLYSLGNEVTAMKLGLENISKLLAALGNPQKNYLKVQVAGTNGKGSVCAFLNSICVSAGVKTGMFTSPHLVSITERVQIDGVPISEGEFARYATQVRSVAEELISDGKLEAVPTFFEQVTAIALIVFANYKVDLAILETGLGGRLDATTAANAEIAVITRIDYDHQEYLGESIEEIAAEKAAIIRPDSVACIGCQNAVALETIKETCENIGVNPKTLEYARFGPNRPAAEFNMTGFQFGEVMLSLEGDHQIENAALAILVAQQLRKFFRISDENIIYGLEQARHPGRIEWVKSGIVQILLDGAHNQSGALALANYLRGKSLKKFTLVFGAMRDKDFELILEPLLSLATDVILTEPANPRALPARRIAESELFKSRKDNTFIVPEVAQAVDSAIQIAETGSWTVVITGSLYLVGEARRALREMRLV